MRAGSYDGGWGWRLPSAMRATGLVGVAGEVRGLIGDRGFAECLRLTLLRLRDEILATGMPAVEVDRCLEMLADPGSCVTAAPTVSVWGRRPPPD
jgi:hypothetical protein